MLNLKKINLINLLSLVVNIYICAEVVETKKIKPEVKVGDSFFIHYNRIHPGQIRISQAYVDQRVQDTLDKSNAIEDKNSKTGYKYKFNDGQSVFDIKDALPIILAPEPYKYVLADGHHELKASLKLGAQYVPVKVIADLSNILLKDFWPKAYSLSYAYPFNLDGKWEIPPKDFKKLVNDSNRHFATIISKIITSDGKIIPHAEPGSYAEKFPVWLKTARINFVEFAISDILRKNGFIYDDVKYKDNPDESMVEKARLILGNNNIDKAIKDLGITSGFQFLPDKNQVQKIVQDIINNLTQAKK